MGKAHIIYFSGTGGTELAAKTLSASLNDKGFNVRMSELFCEARPEMDQGEHLILMYPVYAADAPGPVYDWIASFKKTKSGSATVISVSGGGNMPPNTACRAKAIKRLELKGYTVINEYMLCMPANFIMPTPDGIAKELIRILPEKCKKIADEIAGEVKNRKKHLFIDRILVVLFAAEKLGSKLFGKSLKGSDACSACGLCAKKCPRGNITMENGRPKFGWKCVICMRCIYACPEKAISVRFPVLKRMVIKQGFDLSSIRKSAQQSDAQSIKAPDAGFLWKAVMQYIDEKRV